VGEQERKRKVAAGHQSAAPGRSLSAPEPGRDGGSAAGHRLVPTLVERAAQAGQDVLGGSDVDRGTADRLAQRRGQGSRLPRSLASDFGDRLGTDLSSVRVHTDSEANTISRSLQAKAFTLGQDVYFSSGAFSPDSHAGKRLLAHELSHVAQQARGTGGGGGSRPVVGRANDPAEAEADRMADAVLAGRSVPGAGGHAGHAGQARRCAFGHTPLRRLFGLFGTTAVASAKSGDFQDDDQDIPAAFLDLTDSLIHTGNTVHGGDSSKYNDPSTNSVFGDAVPSGIFAGIGGAAALKGGVLGVKDGIGAGQQLHKAYKKQDWGLGDGAHSDSIGKNAGAVAMEQAVTGTLFGAGGVGGGVVGIVGSAGVEAAGSAAPIIGDVMSLATAAVEGKAAIEDGVAAERLRRSGRSIKHENDHNLPYEFRERRFATFIEDMATKKGRNSKRKDRSRFAQVVTEYRAHRSSLAPATPLTSTAGIGAATNGAGGVIAQWDELSTVGDAWKNWTPAGLHYHHPNNKKKRKDFLDYLKTKGIKEFGYGTELRKEHDKSDEYRAKIKARALARAGGAAHGLTDEDTAYMQSRDLAKMAKFGHRRKAETSTVHAVNAVGNAADGAGGFTAAADFGATKASGKAIKAGVTAYKGIKGLVKRGRRVHKLRMARNEAEYGSGKQRGAWWGVKQFFGSDIDERMKRTRQALKGKNPNKGVRQDLDDDTKIRLLRQTTTQCLRRIQDFMECLVSKHEKVRKQAWQILHVIAESNLAGALSKIEDRDLEQLYKAKLKIDDGSASDDLKAKYKARKSAIKGIIQGQLAGIGG
jgi:hypothetical protein